MKDDYYAPYQLQTPNEPNTKKLVTAFGIVLGTIAIIVLLIVATINIIGSIKGGEGLKNDKRITVGYDGVTFKLADKYGDTIKEIAKQRAIYDYSGYGEFTEIKDIDAYLNSTIAEGRKNTVIKKEDSSLPGVFIEAMRADSVDGDEETLLKDADYHIILYGDHGDTYTIDDKTFTISSTTAEDVETAFPDAEKHEDEQTGIFYEAHYKDRVIGLAISATKKTLYMIEIVKDDEE